MRLEAVAHDAQAAAADGADADAEAEDDNFVGPSKRLPKRHLVALAHADEVLLIERWRSSKRIATSAFYTTSRRESARKLLRKEL